MFSLCMLYCLQCRYILKFASDGAVITHTKNAVQATMKLIPADKYGKVDRSVTLPGYFEKEVILYYYIGKEGITFFTGWPLQHFSLFTAKVMAQKKIIIRPPVFLSGLFIKTLSCQVI